MPGSPDGAHLRLHRLTAPSSDAEWDDLAVRAHALLVDDRGWDAFWESVSPHVERWVASPGFLGRLALDEDHRREVVVQTWEKLQERDLAKLRAFFARPAEGEAGRRLRAWLRRVVKNIGIDHQRTLPEFVRKRGPGPGSPSAPSHDYWRSIVSITSGVAAFEDAGEGRAEAQRLLAFLDDEVAPRRRLAVALVRAGRSLDEVARQVGLRSAREAARVVARAEDRLKFRPALELWSHGFTDDEIATRLELPDGDAAERMIKAAKELLRRAFRA